MARNRLLQAVQSDEDFVETVEDHINRVDGADLSELLEAVPRKELPALCEALSRLADRGAALLHGEGGAGPAPGNEGEAATQAQASETGAEGQPEAKAQQQHAAQGEDDKAGPQERGFALLYGVALVARLILKECGAATPPPPGLAHAAQRLHDDALLAAPEFPALQEEVARLCLEWWQAEAPGRERLSPQAVPYLLVVALQAGTGAAVKRCHALRGALALFDFDDESAADLKRLLLQAFFVPAFLKHAEGRRFLSFLFQLQPAFVRELAAILRNQIPAGRKSVLDAYGDILFRAWTLCTGACALELRHGSIQGLMEAAILASTPAMAANLRRVLAGFHGQKHQSGVDKLLLELYEPILFRRLKAANPEVRRNALAVFLDTFPLRDPEESNDATDARLGEQYALLGAALKDEAPGVRAAAVAGVCDVLNEFWELVPAAVTAGFVKQLAGKHQALLRGAVRSAGGCGPASVGRVLCMSCFRADTLWLLLSPAPRPADELAFDAASPAVRAAVAEGLAGLVDNPLAQPLLKKVLLRLEPLLYDASARVRVAMADLLLALRGIPALRWHDVVDLPRLLDVMAGDAPAVSERIQRLLLPSYFPDLESGPALVAALLRTSPDAGKAFCQYLVGVYQPQGGGVAVTPAGMAVHEDMIVGLIGDLKAHLLEAPAAGGGRGGGGKGRGRGKRKKAAERSDEEGGDQEQEEVVETPESWAAILDGLAALACGLGAQAAAGQASEVSQSLFHSGTLIELLARCPSSGARQAVMAIAAALPHLDASAEVRGRCLKQLLSGDYESAEISELAEELRGAVTCMAAGAASCPRLLRAVSAALLADEDAAEGLDLEQPCATGAGGAARAAGTAARARPAPRATGGKQGGGNGGKKRGGGKKRETDAGVVDTKLACHECGSRKGDMLLCDYCEKAFHLDCLDPPLAGVPEGDWFCTACEADMQRGMSAGMAVRVLGLLLEEEGPRQLLLASGLLPRLLPCIDAVLGGRIAALRRCLAGAAAGEEDEAGVAGVRAAPALVIHLKACLHLYLTSVAPPTGAAEAEAQPRVAVASALRQQALENMQSVVEMAGSLTAALGQLPADELLHAVEVRPTRDAKRAKQGKGKAAGVSALPAEPAGAAREAYEAVLATMMLLGEAAQLQALPWTTLPSNRASAQGAAALAAEVVGLLSRLAEALRAGSAADAGETVVAGVGLVARLARALAGSANYALADGAGRDLNAENWSSGGEPGSSRNASERAGVATALADMVAALMQAGCDDEGGLVAAALKPHLAGLLGAVAEAASSAGDVPTSAACSRWVAPVAQMLGHGFDLTDVPPEAQQQQEQLVGAEATKQGDENAPANEVAAAGSPGGSGGVGKPEGDAARAAAARSSSAATHPLVKQLVAAARLVKAAEVVAGQAAAVALAAWQAGRVEEALGGLALCTLLGLKGLNSRGRSKAGPRTFAAAIDSLKRMQEPAPEATAGSAAAALVRHQLAALFPPPPRVAFLVADGS
eukprot:scaffold20.g7770.t1